MNEPIKLPPLPYPIAYAIAASNTGLWVKAILSIDAGNEGVDLMDQKYVGRLITTEQAEAYARAAIEADRHARGEPIGVEITALIANMAAFLEVSGDPYADPLIKHAREVLSAPQPKQAGEPVFLLKASGPLKEWTPTKAAFDIPDGEHKLYLAQPQQTPEGYKLVPIDPTERMLQAAYNAVESEGMVTTTWLRNAIYRAMLEAAPEPKEPK